MLALDTTASSKLTGLARVWAHVLTFDVQHTVKSLITADNGRPTSAIYVTILGIEVIEIYHMLWTLPTNRSEDKILCVES